MKEERFRIATFYEFKPLEGLEDIRQRLLAEMKRSDVRGTVILAQEGFNATVSGSSDGVGEFLRKAGKILGSELDVKDSFHKDIPFRRSKVKIKPEIVTLRRSVDIRRGEGTHVDSRRWNALIQDPETLVLDSRNDYEVEVGKFRGAVDPQVKSFNELPGYVAQHMSPGKYKRVAMYCTGGIRCEKLAPYLKQEGFEEVYQLDGGILRYLEEMSAEESLWEGECFVFDERVSVDDSLEKGASEDPSLFKNRVADPLD